MQLILEFPHLLFRRSRSAFPHDNRLRASVHFKRGTTRRKSHRGVSLRGRYPASSPLSPTPTPAPAQTVFGCALAKRPEVMRFGCGTPPLRLLPGPNRFRLYPYAIRLRDAPTPTPARPKPFSVVPWRSDRRSCGSVAGRPRTGAGLPSCAHVPSRGDGKAVRAVPTTPRQASRVAPTFCLAGTAKPSGPSRRPRRSPMPLAPVARLGISASARCTKARPTD
jgi:hypothetical protein